MNNPFRFGEAVRGGFFTDREKEIGELRTDLQNGQSVILSSPRRYGKSSLLLKVIEELRTSNVLCVYLDLFRVPSKWRFAEAYSTAIARGTARKIEGILGVLKELLPGIVPKVVLKGEEAPELSIELARPGQDPETVLDRIFDMPQKIAQSRRRRVVVVFDEFQEILQLDGGELLKRLRSHIQHHQDVAYCFLGSRRHLMDELFVRRKSPLYRSGKLIHLDKIPQDKLVLFIRRRFGSTGIDIDPSLALQIVSICQSHPYFVQMLSYTLWNEIGRRRSVRPQDIDAAIGHVITNQSYAYTVIWDSLPPSRRNLLLAIARGRRENLHSQAAVTAFDLGSPSSVSKNLRLLQEAEILEREGDAFSFSDVFFKEWILRKMD